MSYFVSNLLCRGLPHCSVAIRLIREHHTTNLILEFNAYCKQLRAIVYVGGMVAYRSSNVFVLKQCNNLRSIDDDDLVVVC